MSQTGDFMVVFTPRGGFSVPLVVALKDDALATLAHGGRSCQARAALKRQKQAPSNFHRLRKRIKCHARAMIFRAAIIAAESSRLRA
jgi:hypothetical protein